MSTENNVDQLFEDSVKILTDITVPILISTFSNIS